MEWAPLLAIAAPSLTVAGAMLNAGSAATRWGVFDAGMATAWDPAYTVVPQRERLAARQAAGPDAR